jgi:hypothetical protein
MPHATVNRANRLWQLGRVGELDGARERHVRDLHRQTRPRGRRARRESHRVHCAR